MSIPQSVMTRRCEVLAALKCNQYLPQEERDLIASRYGVERYRISEDLRVLRGAGSLRLSGPRGAYTWIKPYKPVPKVRAMPATTQRHCLCCTKAFPSQGNHNRLCSACRAKSWGLI